MSTSNLATDLNYLADAAHLLAEAAPETSAYMMSCRTGLMFANELQHSDVQKQHICGACGHIMIPGHGSALRIESDRALHRQKHHHNRAEKKPQHAKDVENRSGPSKVFSCGHCGRYTKIALPPPGPITRKKTYVHSTVPTSVSRGAESQKQAANASSKRRAKNRKAGLQALIEQSQANRNLAKPALGLSLADFMKN